MFLLRSDRFPFTAEDIRKDIGLKSTKLDPVIEAGIASICMMSRRAVRSETWAIPVDGNFAINASRYGNNVTISEPYYDLKGYPAGVFRDVTFAPVPEAVALARSRVAAWCMNQGDILDALADEGWPHPVTDPTKIGIMDAVVMARAEGRIGDTRIEVGK